MKSTKHRLRFCLLAMLVGLSSARAQLITVTGRFTLVNSVAHEDSIDNSNVAVWLNPVAGSSRETNGISPSPAVQGFRLVQKNKRFSPHVLVVPVGSVVEFPNLDPFFHNVFSLFEGKRFDLGLYEAGTTRVVNFNAQGICYIFCNIHPEMSAVVLAVKTPFYGLSNRKGEIKISDVPPGRYELNVWNEHCLPEFLKGLTREVTLTENSHFLGEIRLTESGNLTKAHKNKYGLDYENPTPSIPTYN